MNSSLRVFFFAWLHNHVLAISVLAVSLLGSSVFADSCLKVNQVNAAAIDAQHAPEQICLSNNPEDGQVLMSFVKAGRVVPAFKLQRPSAEAQGTPCREQIIPRPGCTGLH